MNWRIWTAIIGFMGLAVSVGAFIQGQTQALAIQNPTQVVTEATSQTQSDEAQAKLQAAIQREQAQMQQVQAVISASETTSPASSPSAAVTPSSVTSQAPADYSNPSLTVLSPASGETITMNKPYVIKWSAQGISPSTYVYLTFIPADEQTSYGIPKKIPANADSFAWNFPSGACYSNPCEILPPGQYTLIIQTYLKSDNTEVTEARSNTFTIVSK